MTALSVSIVTYHSHPETLKKTLVSLRASLQNAIDCGLLTSGELTIVENGDESSLVQTILDGIDFGDIATKVISNIENTGFGRGHNLAIRSSPHQFHLILNPDVILSDDAITISLKTLTASAETVLVCPTGVDEKGAPLYLTKRYPSVLVLALRALNLASLNKIFARHLSDYEVREPQTASGETLLASGCYLFCRKQALDEIGGFDDAYFLYFEDFDLSLRLRPLGQFAFPETLTIVHFGGNAARKSLSHLVSFSTSAIRFFNTHGWKWF